MLPVRRSKVKKTLRGLAIGCFVCYGLIGVSPLAFFESTPGSSAASNPDTGSNSGSARERDPFFDAPKYLKVLYESRYMDSEGGRGVRRDLTTLGEETNTKIKRGPKGDWFLHDGRRKKVITIAGEDEDILSAFSRLVSSTDTDIQITFLVPASAEGELIGLNGENIKKIKEKTSAEIGIQTLQKLAESKVIVKGSPEAAEEVARWIMSHMEKFGQDVSDSLTGTYSSRNSEKPALIYIMLTEKQTKRVIGKGGSTIEMIRRDYLVDADVDGDKYILKLAGAIGDVHAAHEYVNSAVLLRNLDGA